MDKRPIGVFDSGVGGLSILKTLTREFPNEDFIYVADLKNCPYGIKTKPQIAGFVSDISNYLVAKNAKAIVIACNTATANSDHLKLPVPVIGMIQATANETSQYKKIGRTLVLATQATVDSHLYQHALKAYDIEAVELACTEFVTLVESGQNGTQHSSDRVAKHLKPYQKENFDTVILGCTHFGFLKHEIQNCFPEAVLVGGDNEVSRQLRFELERRDALELEPRSATVTLLTTGEKEAFENKVGLMNIVYDKLDSIITD